MAAAECWACESNAPVLQTSIAQHPGTPHSENVYTDVLHVDKSPCIKEPCRWHWSMRAGNVDWMPHLPQLLTHIQWSFQVPVGGATAQSPIGEALGRRSAPPVVQNCVAYDCSALHANGCPDSIFSAATLSEAVLNCSDVLQRALHCAEDWMQAVAQGTCRIH